MNIKSKKSVARQFHEATKQHKDIKVQYNEYKPGIQYKRYTNTKKTLLTSIIEEDVFVKTLINRRSRRDFSEKELSFFKLSSLIELSTKEFNIGGFDSLYANEKYRTTPSAGKRYPLELYIISFNSDKLEKGIYHYDYKENALELLKVGDYREQVRNEIINQDFIETCSCVLVISAIFERTMEKYNDRGYRYILIDSGHLGQNIYLMSQYLDMKSVSIGGFNDNEFAKLLSLDLKDENVIYAFALGE